MPIEAIADLIEILERIATSLNDIDRSLGVIADEGVSANVFSHPLAHTRQNPERLTPEETVR